MQLNKTLMVIVVTKSLQLLFVMWSTYAKDGEKYSGEMFQELEETWRRE